MIRIDLIAGARPNFVKIAPIIHEIEAVNSCQQLIKYRLIHTGQHYDRNMSDTFFEQLSIPDPHFNLGCGSGTQAEQTAGIMVGYEKLLFEEKPDVCLVVGDVTSTMACSIVAQKMHVKVVHVEAGIRSGDWSMPEEINRMVTDSITNYFFTTTRTAGDNLRSSGISEERIFFVGNTMIDTLLRQRDSFLKPYFWDNLKLETKQYIVLTLHRPSNVDDDGPLRVLLEQVLLHSKETPIIFPIHPRTAKILKGMGMSAPRLHVVEPMSYLEFNYLVENAMAVITDSGGITEETTVLNVPCITIRESTERPETVTIGTNELIGTNPQAIGPTLSTLFEGKWKKGTVPELWDGKTSSRIIDHLLKIPGL